MKRILLGIATLLTVGASAQLTYVGTVNNTVKTPLYTGLNDNAIEGGNYLVSTVTQNTQYEILNSDFTLYKSITIDTVGFSALGYKVHNVFFSNHLYNTDDKIEIVYVVYNKSPYKPVRTVILNEDGIELEVVNGFYVVFHTPFIMDNKTYLKAIGITGEYAFYEAAGTIPCDACGSTGSTTNKKAPEKVYDITLYPNPTASTITLAINTDKTNMLVHIYSMDGKLVKTTNVVNGNNLYISINCWYIYLQCTN